MLIRMTSENFATPEIVEWDDFAADNADAFDADELAEMESDLRNGREVEFGGGAALLITVRAEG